MAERSGVVCGGSWILDRINAIPDWPAEETVTEIMATTSEGGGPGFNMAMDLKRLRPSLNVEAIGLVGDDADGRFMKATVAAAGIEVGQLRLTAEASTSLTYVMSAQRTGRRTFFSLQGANALLAPEDFDFAASRARILHLGLPGLMRRLDQRSGDDLNGWVSVLKAAGRHGLSRNMEIASIPAEKIAAIGRPCLPHLDLLVINDFEIGALAGLTTVSEGRTDIAAVRRAARIVLEMGAMEIVVVHFPRGAIAVTRQGLVVEQPSVRVPQVEVQGSNGAGDAFAAGVLLTLHDGGGLDRALALGHCVAAASLRSLTTVGSVEDEAACLGLAEAWGWRERLDD